MAVFGDSFTGDKMGDGKHYPSVAVPVTFDEQGRPTFGEPMNLPEGLGPLQLFPPPTQARGTNALPAGSIQLRDGTTYMMVAGTKDLKPVGGSWMVEVNDNPGAGWAPIDGTYRAPQAGMPSQISGFQAADGNVYIAADSFDRTQGVTMYRGQRHRPFGLATVDRNRLGHARPDTYLHVFSWNRIRRTQHP